MLLKKKNVLFDLKINCVKFRKFNILGIYYKMRFPLTDTIYETALDTDDNDSLNGIKIAPMVQSYFGLFGVDVKSTKEDLFQIIRNSSKLSTFESLVKKYDLEYTLKNNEDITVFAPTNTAFKNIEKTLDQLDKTTIEDILLSHIVDDKLKASDLEDGETLDTLGSLQLTIEEDEDDYYVETPGVKAQVRTMDIRGSNGYIHTIDEVLIPKVNVTTLISGNILLESLTSQLTSSNLVSTLNGMDDITVLAPYDSAFAASQTTLDDLSASDVTDVLLSHVIDSKYLAKDLDHDDEIPTLGSVKLTVKKEDGKVYFEAPGSKAEVKVADIEADNGVIHLLDKVLLP